jgi:hypothetical protein
MSFVKANNILITSLIWLGRVENFNNIRLEVAKLYILTRGHVFPNAL